MKHRLITFLCAILYPLSAMTAITLDFEGLKNNESINEFYAGGIGSLNSRGPDYGIIFSDTSLAIIDRDAGGTGNFANEPSPDTVAYFLEGDAVTMNVPEGFSHGFSFFYSSIDYDGSIQIYDGLNGTGNIIKEIALPALGSKGKGDPQGFYDTWKATGVSFPGKAKSVNFSGVANRIGFDDITLDFRPPEQVLDLKLSLDRITRGQHTDASNGVSIFFKEVTSDLGEDDVKNLCSNYRFTIKDGNNRGAEQYGCSVKKQRGDGYALQVDFTVKEDGNGDSYFENGEVILCSQQAPDKCGTLSIISDFTVYATSFNIKDDAYSFKNGEWRKAVTNDDAANTPKNDLARIITTINPYLSTEMQQDLWDSAGHRNGFFDAWGEGEFWTKSSEGLCYGMAVSAAANFNLAGQSAWGIGGNLTSDFKRQIDNRWSEEELGAKAPFKPFSTDSIYTFNKNDSEALKKIVYYFVGQPSYYNGKTLHTTWVGNDSRLDLSSEPAQWRSDGSIWVLGFNDAKDRNNLLSLVKSGNVIPATFYLSGENGGHAILFSEYISYNNADAWYGYDNNLPDGWIRYSVKNNNDITIISGKNDMLIRNDGYTYKIKSLFSTFPRRNTQSIYSARKMESSSPKPPAFNPYPYHIYLGIIGGNITSIKDSESGDPITPLITNRASIKKSNTYISDTTFGRDLLIPKDQSISITVQRHTDSPAFNLFTKTVDANGLLVGENFTQALNNIPPNGRIMLDSASGKITISDADGLQIEPDSRFDIPTVLRPIEKFALIKKGGSVYFTWDMPAEPNFDHVEIVKNALSAPSSRDDGENVYTGNDSTATVNISNAEGYYSIFSVDSEGHASAPSQYYLGNESAGIIVKTIDSERAPIEDATVTVWNSNKTQQLDAVSSNRMGYALLPNLSKGDYVLTVNHPGYIFSEAKSISIDGDSPEVVLTGRAKQSITVSVNNEVAVGSTQTILWSGHGIEKGERGSVEYQQGDKWKTIADEVAIDEESVEWVVPGDYVGASIIRITLLSNETIRGEKPVSIVKSATQIAGDSQSHGGGSGPVSLILLGLLAWFKLSSMRKKRTNIDRLRNRWGGSGRKV